MMTGVTFTINGEEFHVPTSISADTSLNVFIRDYANLRGTKSMCHEGGCGACIVSVKSQHPVSHKMKSYSVNSCLVSVLSCHGWEVTTVEGLGDKSRGYHEVQKRLAQFNGTQCGYCSPGMVMNMNSLLESNENITMSEVENSFGGNICRCTGYRPILDAFKSLCSDANETLLRKCQDIEDLDKIKTCPKTGSSCSESCLGSVSKSFSVNVKDSTWYKVDTVEGVLDIFRKIGDMSYLLVAGNTAKGVYRIKNTPQVYIDVSSVSELKQYEVLSNIILGGGITLTETMKYLTKASKLPQFAYVKELVHHIDLIANVPVRNIGTLAGNLSIKHQNNEFPSDIFLIFETVGAKICIVAEDGSKVSVTPCEYLKLDMRKRIIVSIALPPITGNYAFKTYKIMPRAQNAHAYVNAGFYIQFSNGAPKIVEQATVVFGGINPQFVHASDVEHSIVGKNLFDNIILTSTLNILNAELNPDWVLPDASPKYRRNLALSLFYKFVLNTCPPELITPAHKSGADILSRGLSSGQQSYDTNKNVWPLNQPIRKVEAVAQCSGEAQYVNDLPAIPGELFAAFVLATRPLANLVSMDASEALKINGVKRFITAKDIPGKNVSIGTKLSMIDYDVEILVSKKVLYSGQPCGIIVAESQTLAIRAAKLVRVKYEETDNKPVVSVRQALAKGDESRISEVVDVKPTGKLGSNVDKVIKGSFDMGGQYHYTMETQTCVCIPIEDGMDVYSATQWMDAVHLYVSEALNMPQSRINLHVRRLGGGYGGKINPPNYIATACAVAAHLMNKPMRMVLPLEDNMDIVGKRFGCCNNYEVGVDSTGKIQYLKIAYYQDFGCNLNDPVWFSSRESIKNCYDTKTWEYQAYTVVTDVASNTWCRAPGGTEGLAMIENIMEHISHATGVDPILVRLANMAEEDSRLGEIIHSFIPSIDYEIRKTKVEEFNQLNRWKKRGIAIVPMKYRFEVWGTFVALVSVYYGDGTVSVSHGGIECGQGINTKVAQVCAYTLGIPLEYVVVKPSNNLIAPNSTVTGGSIASEACCYAVLKACQILLERLEETKSKMDNPTWTELVKQANLTDINLSANYMFTSRDDVKSYPIWGISAAEVEVDILTGNLQILRVDILEDTGESLSPEIDVGQVEGAFIMGLGYWLNEQLIFSEDSGALLTNRTWTYKPPGAKDIPIDFRIKFLSNAPNPIGVLRSKATGEPPLCMSIVAVFAIRNALKSARADVDHNNTEWVNLGAPSTAEHVFLQTLNDYRLYTL